MKCSASLLVAGITVSMLSSSASAALLTYHLDFQVTTIGGPMGGVSSSDISVGDLFYVQFTMDDSVQDVDGSSAQFPGLYTSLLIARAPDNAGSWDPRASGVWSLPATAYAGSGDTAVIFNGSGFQGVSYSTTFPFPSSGTSTTPIFNPQFIQDHTDTGVGQTFAEMFGTLNPSSINTIFSFDNVSVQGNSLNFAPGVHPQIVPEPSSFAIVAAGLGGVLLTRRKRSDAIRR